MSLLSGLIGRALLTHGVHLGRCMRLVCCARCTVFMGIQLQTTKPTFREWNKSMSCRTSTHAHKTTHSPTHITQGGEIILISTTETIILYHQPQINPRVSSLRPPTTYHLKPPSRNQTWRAFWSVSFRLKPRLMRFSVSRLIS